MPFMDLSKLHPPQSTSTDFLRCRFEGDLLSPSEGEEGAEWRLLSDDLIECGAVSISPSSLSLYVNVRNVEELGELHLVRHRVGVVVGEGGVLLARNLKDLLKVVRLLGGGGGTGRTLVILAAAHAHRITSLAALLQELLLPVQRPLKVKVKLRNHPLRRQLLLLLVQWVQLGSVSSLLPTNFNHRPTPAILLARGTGGRAPVEAAVRTDATGTGSMVVAKLPSRGFDGVRLMVDEGEEPAVLGVEATAEAIGEVLFTTMLLFLRVAAAVEVLLILRARSELLVSDCASFA
ncbi:hypothetical protein TYRP_002506 [Tyrophagus putrescentiae]|nr:hypothetical protein TYRP_002506 [Tyrophagus putrescentiae]